MKLILMQNKAQNFGGRIRSWFPRSFTLFPFGKIFKVFATEVKLDMYCSQLPENCVQTLLWVEMHLCDSEIWERVQKKKMNSFCKCMQSISSSRSYGVGRTQCWNVDFWSKNYISMKPFQSCNLNFHAKN